MSYKGTNYHGFQIQKNAVTVQYVFQEALQRVLGELPGIKGCSRTDAGVHAREYCVSFRTPSEISCENLVGALNFYLPSDIRVRSAEEVCDGFHARYSCKAKRYCYLVYNSRVMDPFLEGLAFRFTPFIDVEELNRAAGYFVGKHDFAPFSANRGDVKDTQRQVFCFTVARQGDLVTFLVTADGFLYNMARVMAGTLLSVARGALEPNEIDEIFAKNKRTSRCFTAPPWGLYLDRVYYGFRDTEWK